MGTSTAGEGPLPQPHLRTGRSKRQKIFRCSQASRSDLDAGKAPLSEYFQLLDDWNLISDRAEEESFKLDEYLGSNHSNWAVTGEGLTPSEKRRLQGWSMEDVERLRSRDPELVSEYRRELEKEAVAHAEKGKDYREWEENRKIWIEARLADIDSAVDSKILLARRNDLDARFSRWVQIEKLRTSAEDNASFLLWAETPEDARPEKPVRHKGSFPESLSPEMRNIYETIEEKQFWRAPSREAVDEYEALVGQLVALSKELSITPGIAREMARSESGRAQSELRFGPRVPIPTDYGWYEYCSLVMDDEASFQREIDDEVRRSGNLWIHWAKELVGMLPTVTRRAVELGKHPISEIPKDRVPESLRVLFEQAHMLYIFDFDIPCLLTCGGLVEELVRKEFPDLNDKWSIKQSLEHKSVSWKSKVNDVVSQYPKFQSAKRHLLDIWYVRNDAAHDPAKYLTAGKSSSEEILRKTRKVLEVFFEVAKPQAEEI